MNTPIYFDYAATTPVDPRVVEKMMKCLSLEDNFGNPASRSHIFGWRAEEAVEKARGHVAELIGADPREIIWTSGATEASNLAIKGAMGFYAGKGNKGKHLLTSSIEHKATLDSCRYLESKGFEVTYIKPDSNGVITVSAVREALREDTVLATIMHANNEIGSLNEIAEIGALLRDRGVIFHVDAAQTVGKIPIAVDELKVDLLSISAHKLYGPKGIGALYVRRKPRVRLEAQIHGGGHERGMRSGTLPTHQIVGMGEACLIALNDLQTEAPRIAALRDHLWNSLSKMEEVYLNGHPERCLPGILNVSFNFVEGESLIMSLKDLALSSGSACTSASLEPSYVLRALGRSDELAHSSLRFSIGRYTNKADIDTAIEKICSAVAKLRTLSPLWEMHKDGVDIDSIEWAAH